MEITFLIPAMSGGGAEKVNLLIGNELVKRGYKITYLMCQLKGPYMKLVDPKINIVKLPYPTVAKNLIAISRYLFNHKIDIFYSSLNYVNAIAGIAHYLSRSKSKLILSDHNNITSVLNNFKGNKFLFRNTVRFSYSKADLVLCVSEGVEHAIHKEFGKVRTKVIYNPIEMFNPNFNKGNKSFNILNIGRLSEQKNQELLIRAVDKVIDANSKRAITLTILGEGNLRSELENLIQELNREDYIFLPGFTDNLQEELDNAHLFVLSSDREGFGNVIVEAMSAGLPIVSTDCPSGPSEILENGKYGYLTPVKDVKALVKNISIALNNEHLYSKQSMEKRIERANDFSVDIIVDEYIYMFNNIL